MTLSRECLRAALSYARRGWAVFPLNGKRPYPGTHGHRDATTDPATIRGWWREWPDANVGISCSSTAGPIVLDVDGPTGWELLGTLDLPPTREATSRREHRRHFYFDPPTSGIEVKRRLHLQGQKLDILGDGGYVVAPPSVHPSTGKRYKWLNEYQLAPLPESVLKLLGPIKRGPAPPLPDIFEEGQRDELLTSLAGSMRRRNASPDAMLAALREENATRCNPPLEDRQLRKIVRSISKKSPVTQGEHLTDLGNARRFIRQHAETVRSLSGLRRSWLIWDDVRWTPDETGEVSRLAKATVRSIHAEADQAEDVDMQTALGKHATSSESANSIRAMLDLAATEPEISVTPAGFDADPWLFNVENGTLNLRTGKLQAHRREDLITKLSPVQYDPAATAPRWQQFLEEIFAGDADLIAFMQRAVGYSLTGDTREHCLFFCYGKGRNGKSTFLETIRDLAGDYAQTADFTTFQPRRGDGPRTDIARMRGARFISAVEAEGDKGFDATVLKQLTGGDTIVARQLYEKEFEFRPQHKLFLAANHQPVVKDNSLGFWSKIKMVPFIVTFTPKQQDKKLAAQLRLELPGILNWALEGARLWRENGLTSPKAIRAATTQYKDENDLIGEFFDQRCEKNGGWTSNTELYRAFSEWYVETRGQRAHVPSMIWFNRAVGDTPNVRRTKTNGNRGWRGVVLLNEIR
jgi:putative DNA primase/helicase